MGLRVILNDLDSSNRFVIGSAWESVYIFVINQTTSSEDEDIHFSVTLFFTLTLSETEITAINK